MDPLSFFKSALKDQPLKEDVIRQLCVRAGEGSASAREELLRAHVRLVVYVARHFYKPGCFFELADLVQQGCLGVLHALGKFDPQKRSRGRSVRFATYAHYWISHYIRREIENNGRTISIPIHRLKGSGSLHSSRRLPSAYSLDQMEEWLEDETGAAFARLVDVRDTSDAWCRAWEARQNVEYALKTLSPRKQKILKHRYGLTPDEKRWSQKDLGKMLGVSSGLISLLERDALDQIRELNP